MQEVLETVGVPAVVFLTEVRGDALHSVFNDSVGAAVRRAVARSASAGSGVGVKLADVLLGSLWWQGHLTVFNDTSAANVMGNQEEEDAAALAGAVVTVGGRRRRVQRQRKFLPPHRAPHRALALDMASAANASKLAEGHGGSASSLFAALSVLCGDAASADSVASAVRSADGADMAQAISMALSDATGLEGGAFAVDVPPAAVGVVTLKLTRRRWALVWAWILARIGTVVGCGVALLFVCAACAARRAHLRRRAAAAPAARGTGGGRVLVKDAYVDAVRAWEAKGFRGTPRNLGEPREGEAEEEWAEEEEGASAPLAPPMPPTSPPPRPRRAPTRKKAPTPMGEDGEARAAPRSARLPPSAGAPTKAPASVARDADRVRQGSTLKAAGAKARLANAGKRVVDAAGAAAADRQDEFV
jgi:hypothetical protein